MTKILHLIVISIFCSLIAYSQQSKLKAYSVNSGFALSTGNNEVLRSVVGTSDIIIADDGTNYLTGGFLAINELKNVIKLSSENNPILNNNEIRVFPNPVSNTAYVELYLEYDSEVMIDLVDITGKQIPLESGKFAAGENIIPMNFGEGITSGIFYLKTTVNNEKFKMTLIEKVIVID
jgi:hypothetical protein